MARIDGTFEIVDARSESGWHLHFISNDKKYGGHVFDFIMKSGKGHISKINEIEIKLPDEPIFDTYSLKQVTDDEVKAVEQGKGE